MRMRGKALILVTFTLYSSTLCEVFEVKTTYKWDKKVYKLMYQAETWDAARRICAVNGAKLAVPKSVKEFLYLQRIVRRMHYPSVIGTDYKLLVWLGITKLENYQTWKNVDGKNIEEDTGFHSWAGEHNGALSGNDPKQPHCAGMDAINFGLRDYWCHRPQPYICEIKT